VLADAEFDSERNHTFVRAAKNPLAQRPFDADQVLNSLPAPTTCPTQILFGLIPKAHFTKNYPVKMLYRVCARSFDYFPRQALDSL
jgi:hypothetical protein